MRRSAFLALAACLVIFGLAPGIAAGATTRYATHVVLDSSTQKAAVRASASLAVWSDRDRVASAEGVVAPLRLFLHNTGTGETVCLDSGPIDPCYDVGMGFVGYAAAPEFGGRRWIKLYDVARAVRSDIATATTLEGLACGDGFMAWADREVHIYDYASGTETTVTGQGTHASLSADGDEVVWIEPSENPEIVGKVHAFNTQTREHRSTTIPSFSPVACSVSPAGVLIEGEEPKYYSALYLWNPDTGRSSKLVGVEDAYHAVGGARASSKYVAWGYRSSLEFPLTRIAVMNLASGSWELVYPYLSGAFIGDIVDSRLWFVQARSGDSGSSICYTDIIPSTDTSTDGESVSGGSGTVQEEAVTETETVDASATVAATVPPESTTASSGQTPSRSASVIPPAGDGSGAPWLALVAVGGLTVVGGGAWLARRRIR